MEEPKGLNKIRKYLKEKENLMHKITEKINQEEVQSTLKDKNTHKHWGLTSKQRKVDLSFDKIPNNMNNQPRQNQAIKMRNYDSNKLVQPFNINILQTNKYFPPSCSGYDIVYCKANDSLYIYGGISCSTQLHEGLKPYFYRCSQGSWSQVKPSSQYSPIPRYGHSLTVNNKQIILFGGVSEYKEKLKDRCFYSDLSSYHTVKNKWKVMENTGARIKNRRSHTACMYQRFYIVYGGIDDNQEVLNQINWINFQSKKVRWKSAKVEPRFNHKMSCIQNENGKDFICIFGGRNANSDVTNSFLLYPVSLSEGDLLIKQPIILTHYMSARQMPIMGEINQNLIILGGTDEDNDMVNDTWSLNIDKMSFNRIDLKLEIKQLRGSKGVSIHGQKLFILTSNSLKYKALQISKW